MIASRALAVAAVSLAVAAGVALADNNVGSAGPFTYIEDNSAPVAATGAMAADAACPAGTHVSGGGFTVSSSPPGESHVVSSYPIDGPDSDRARDDGWSALAWNDVGADKTVKVTAVCAAFRVTYVSRRATLPAASARTQSARCPDGLHATGGGLRISRPGNLAWLNRSLPIDAGDQDARPDDGWRGRVYNNSGLDEMMTVFALCADRRIRYLSETEVDPPYTFVTCTGTSHVTGGGISVSGPANYAHVFAIDPYAAAVNPPDSGIVTVISNDLGGSKTVTSFALCGR